MSAEVPPCPFCSCALVKSRGERGLRHPELGCILDGHQVVNADDRDAWAARPHPYPTEDAYMAACRALHWRTAQLRAHGIEPCAIPPDAPHVPPEGYEFGPGAMVDREPVQ